MHRVAQFFGHITARVSADDEAMARGLLPPGGWQLFAQMPVADQRHGLDVVGRLLVAGWDDRDLLAAALLHDAAKGERMRLWHRVGGVLLEGLSPRLLERLASRDPQSRRYAWYLYLHHADLSADAAAAAGCSERTAAFIRGSASGSDEPARLALQAADEAA